MKLALTLTVIITLCLLAWVPTLSGNAATRGWCEEGNQTVATGGQTSSTKVQKSLPSCTITVYLAGTVTPATIYSDNAGSPTPLANPFTALSNGSWKFYAAAGLYDVVMSGGGLSSPVTLAGVSMIDPTALTTVTMTGLTVNGAATVTGNVGADTVSANSVSSVFLSITATLFASLGTPANGTIKYCSNCTVASPCAGSGTGAIAKRLNGGWVCN